MSFNKYGLVQIHAAAPMLGVSAARLEKIIKENKIEPALVHTRFSFYEMDALKKACERQMYNKKRNSFIKEAEKYADEIAGEKSRNNLAQWRNCWDRAFLKRMAELADRV